MQAVIQITLSTGQVQALLAFLDRASISGAEALPMVQLQQTIASSIDAASQPAPPPAPPPRRAKKPTP